MMEQGLQISQVLLCWPDLRVEEFEHMHAVITAQHKTDND
jgi:hypothetical protein